MGYEELIKVISDLAKVFLGLLGVEQLKLTASLNNDIELLQSCMAKEQAASMELKGLERKRLDAVEKLGFQGLSFPEMIERADDEYALELKVAVDMLNGAIRDFRNLSQDVHTVIEMNLANLNMLLAQRQQEQQTSSADKGSGGRFTNFKA